MYLEDVGPGHGTHVPVLWQREDDVQRVVGGILVVAYDDEPLAFLRQPLTADDISSPEQQCIVYQAQVSLERPVSPCNDFFARLSAVIFHRSSFLGYKITLKWGNNKIKSVFCAFFRQLFLVTSGVFVLSDSSMNR